MTFFQYSLDNKFLFILVTKINRNNQALVMGLLILASIYKQNQSVGASVRHTTDFVSWATDFNGKPIRQVGANKEYPVPHAPFKPMFFGNTSVHGSILNHSAIRVPLHGHSYIVLSNLSQHQHRKINPGYYNQTLLTSTIKLVYLYHKGVSITWMFLSPK